MPYTLVVIDMQQQFEAACWPKTIAGVTKEITRAIEHHASIVFLEYGFYNGTHQELLDLVKGYTPKSRVSKKFDDGSRELIKTLKRRKFPRNLRVCGVNTSCCVHATVDGLFDKDPDLKIELVKRACGCSIDGNQWSLLRATFRDANFTLV